MSHQHSSRTPRPIRFLFENSLFLVFGAAIALIWANVDSDSYDALVHYEVIPSQKHESKDHGAESEAHGKHESSESPHHESDEAKPDDHADDAEHDEHPDEEHADDGPEAEGPAPPAEHSEDDASHGDDHAVTHDGEGDTSHGGAQAASHGGDASHGDGDNKSDHGGSHGHGKFTLHWVVNDLLMALFFAIAGKEVWESILPGGALSNPRKAATPLLATLGGIVGPAGVYLIGVAMLSDPGSLGRGWAIPCATDIAFSYLVARMIFGAGHPAIAFLLLLAIADDAAGLVILAVFFPQGDLAMTWLLLAVFAVALGFVFRKLRLHSFWFYLLIPGSLCWYSFFMAGLHPALGLVPIIPCMPHAHTDLGLFAMKERNRSDTLNEFEHWWKNPVELILGLFGLLNAGVVMSSVGAGTWLVLAGLLVGKPLGITFFTWVGEKLLRLEVPAGMGYRHVFVLGNIAAIGFTVALFMSTAAFPEGKFPKDVLDSVKMGALMSFGAAVVSFVVAKLLGIRATSLVSSPKDAGATPANAVVSGS